MSISKHWDGSDAYIGHRSRKICLPEINIEHMQSIICLYLQDSHSLCITTTKDFFGAFLGPNHLFDLQIIHLTHWGRDKMAAISCCRWHFKIMHYLEWKLLKSNSNFTEICFQVSNWQPALVHIMATGAKPLSEPMMALLADAYVCHSASVSWNKITGASPTSELSELEQLEGLRSEIPPAAPWLSIPVIHIRSQVKRRQSQSYKLKKIAKNSNFEILQEAWNVTHRLKLLDMMYKYEMDQTRTVGATEQTRDAGWTDGQTEGRSEINIPHNNFVVRRVW